MFQANNDFELLNALSEIDISVPERSKGRTKEDTERYSIAHLLSALVGKDRFSYPLRLICRERPDFLLTTGTIQIGIEHTEAVPQNEAHKTILRERRCGPDSYFISHHQPGESRKPAKRLIEEIEANRPYNDWDGDSVDREWAEAMFYFIEQKVAALLKEGFQRFDVDWLLIYDNWSLPPVTRHKAASFLFNLVIKSVVLEKFEHIFIISGHYICEFTEQSIQFHEKNDFWH